jgi:hypothetical protein
MFFSFLFYSSERIAAMQLQVYVMNSVLNPFKSQEMRIANYLL